jgi:UDP-glucose 4-epimerase
MKKVAIVTGAYGYIGSVLTKLLNEEGYYVIGIDIDPRALNTARFIRNSRTKYCDEFICEDFTSKRSLQIINDYPHATVFHLAANSLLGPSAYIPLDYYENNTAKTINLLQILEHSHKLVFASTAAVYAETDSIVSENSLIDPPNNYGKTKLWCEQVFDACYEARQLRVASFRFFNVIGAYEDVGQLPDTPHIINKLCDKALRSDTPFVISGDDYPTFDGTCVRDYLHVVDVCRALIHAARHMESSKPCSLKYNLGTGIGNSVMQIVNKFNEICTNLDHRIGIRRIGDPPFLVADPSKFVQETGFKYKYSADLDSMIRSAWEYRSKY